MAYDFARPKSAKQAHRGLDVIEVQDEVELMDALPDLKYGRHGLRILFPIIPESDYLLGTQNPHNAYMKHKPVLKLDEIAASHNLSVNDTPMYRLRRLAYHQLHIERNARLRNGDYSLTHLTGLSWPSTRTDRTRRWMPIQEADEGIESYVVHSLSNNPVDAIHIRAPYDPKQAAKTGAVIWFGVRSRSTPTWYKVRDSQILSFAMVPTDDMISRMAAVKTSLTSGHKGNLRTKFTDAQGQVYGEPLVANDIEAILGAINHYQLRFKAGEVPGVYDFSEKVKVSVPMYLNPIPLTTPREMEEHLILHRNTTIVRPKRDRVRGGFLRNKDGSIVWDKERPIWEAEEQPIKWTRIAEIGYHARFVRGNLVDKLKHLFE